MTTIKVESEAHWLSLREQNIGGSEVAALFNRWRLPDGDVITLHAYEEVPPDAVPLGSCSPYTTAYRVFLEKTGKVMPPDFNSERMQAGTYLEPALAEWAKNKWDWKLRKVRRYSTHPTIAGWGCSVDYEVHGPGMEPVELKNIDGLVARRNWLIEGDEIIVPPLHIILQLQHYIGAREAAQGWTVACVGGNELVRGSTPRHDATIERIGEAITAFWEGVRLGIPPIETVTFDDVSDEFAYGQPGPEPVDLTDDESAAALARRYLRWKKHAEFTDVVVQNIKGRLAVKVGEATKARGAGFRVTWPVIERPENVIPERVQAAKTYRGGFTVTEV